MTDTYLRPRTILDTFSRLNPGVWKQVDDLRERRKSIGNWPDWCFLPLAGAYAIISNGGAIETPEQLRNLGRLGAFAAWRVTQGIYRFDPTTFDALWKTPVTGDIPTAVLHHLPEWCVYIPTPDKTWKGEPLYGFFAHLEHDANSQRTELRFMLDLSESPGENMVGVPIHLGIGGVAEAVDAALSESARNAPFTFVPSEAEVEMLKQDVPPLVSLVLYLCSQNAEIRDATGGTRVPTHPRPERTKKGMRLFPPDRPNQWQVGYRIGAALRRAPCEHDPGESTGSHSRPRPHIRRAHWHSFWVGKWDEPAARSVILKWLPPIPVNVQCVDDLTTTVRAVSRE